MHFLQFLLCFSCFQDNRPSSTGAVGGAESDGSDIVVLDLDEDKDEGSHVSMGFSLKTMDLSDVGLVDVSGPGTSQRTNLSKMKHNRYGAPLHSLVRVVLISLPTSLPPF